MQLQFIETDTLVAGFSAALSFFACLPVGMELNIDAVEWYAG